MTRIQLQIVLAPAEAQVFLRIKQIDGSHKPVLAVVDTGAEISLLPSTLMTSLDYRLISSEPIIAQQAGIANQLFEAYVANVKLYLEDTLGNQTVELEVPVLFADGDTAIIGFEGLLDRAVLHIDMPALTGYIELPDYTFIRAAR
jgi:predicted aspartyl protease